MTSPIPAAASPAAATIPTPPPLSTQERPAMTHPDQPGSTGSLYDDLQQAIRDVIVRHGELPTSDAVVIVETLTAGGITTLAYSGGELSAWGILGRLEFVRADITSDLSGGRQL